MNSQDAAPIIGAIALLVGAYVAWRKYQPETNDITVTAASKVNEMTLKFADVVDQDNDDLREQLKALRAEFTKYREDTDSRLAELSTRLRASVAENVRLEDENGRLKKRVTELESEVGRLRDGAH